MCDTSRSHLDGASHRRGLVLVSSSVVEQTTSLANSGQTAWFNSDSNVEHPFGLSLSLSISLFLYILGRFHSSLHLREFPENYANRVESETK